MVFSGFLVSGFHLTSQGKDIPVLDDHTVMTIPRLNHGRHCLDIQILIDPVNFALGAEFLGISTRHINRAIAELCVLEVS